MSGWIPIDKDPKHVAKEKEKARKLRNSQWWKNEIAKGICHYCGGHFRQDELTMDHVTPISRGGKSTKGNIVPCCKECNNKKKHFTPAELLMEKLKKDESKSDES